jgi:hypothetical protein
MKENNLVSSMEAMVEETGVYWSDMTNKGDFIENVKRGAWHLVLKSLQTSRLHRSVAQRLYE